MGLDMYLTAQRYVSGFRHQSDEERNEYERLVQMWGMEDFIAEDSPGAYVEFTIGYWRKANQIHSWFVHHVQEGLDECQTSYVSREKLEELRSTCEFVLGTREKVGVNVSAANRVAAEKLPTQQGFFFGTYEYDDWYWDDLRHTVEVIDRALSLLEREGEFWIIQYRSSW